MTTNLPPPSRPAPSIPSRASPRPVKHYPHIQDLIARTNILHDKPPASIKKWLDTADEFWLSAKSKLMMNILDGAYVDYLLAFTVVADIIPRCPTYPTFRVTETRDRQRYRVLCEELRKEQDKYDQVKEKIRADNAISGVQSTEEKLAAQPSRPTPNPVRSRSPYLQEDVLTNGSIPRKAVPTPQPQPETNGTTNNTDEDELAKRFSRLSNRTPGATPGTRPQLNGPREMPTKPRMPPLEMTGQLPRMPPPTYSPSTSYGTPGGLEPRRSSMNRAPTYGIPEPPKPAIEVAEGPTITAELLYKYLQGSSGLSVLLLDVRTRDEFNQGYIYGGSVVCIEPIILREGMSGDDVEQALVLSSSEEQKLFERRHTFNVVVYYDQSTSSTAYLSSSVTKDERQLALRRLHYAINDYAFEKKLQRPPFLLEGGVNAWIDLMGPASLRTVQDAPKDAFPRRSLALRRPQVQRSVTPATMERSSYRLSGSGGAPSGPSASNLDGAHHSHPAPPIDVEEEAKWLAELQKEGRPLTMGPPARSGEDIKKHNRKISIVTQNDPGYVRTVEEFIHRYPATPHGANKESMQFPSTEHHTPDTPGLNRRNTIIDHPFYGFSDVRNPDFHPPASPSRPLPVAARKSYSGVSERLGPSTPTVPATSSFEPFRPQPGGSSVTIGNTGLKNLGNTCYMNSILQCMSGTVPICRYFLDGTYKSHINRNNPLSSRGVLAEAFATLVRHLRSGEYTFISPVTFKNVSGRLNETFKSNEQQDAQEFLDFLLDGLHEDLNANANRTKLNPLTEEEERRREKLPLYVAAHREWQRYTHQNYSIVVNWLQGQLASKLRCLTCNTTSTTYTPFMYLSLPIPLRNATFTLHDCLDEFTKEEILDGSDAWLCPTCKTRRKATKQLTITRLPPILIVHLKRFTSRGRWGDKLNTPIKFPLDNFDLTGYFPAVEEKDGGRDWGVPKEAETTPPFQYELYGVVNHFGTLHGGHYTAYVRNGWRNWFTFDDSRAVKMEVGEVVTRNAYVLFFVRKNVF